MGMFEVSGTRRSRFNVVLSSIVGYIKRLSHFFNMVTSNIYAFLMSGHPFVVSFNVKVSDDTNISVCFVSFPAE